jgi:sec-independent protein translocase protein TatC
LAETIDQRPASVTPAVQPDMGKEKPPLPDEGQELTLMEHLIELRDRVMRMVLGLAVGTVVGFIFSKRVFMVLIRPLGHRATVIALSPTESILMYFKVALIVGIVIAMPLIIWEIAQFVLPGLYDNERTYVYYLVPSATVAFAGGAAFAAFLAVPAAVQYLSGFMADIVTPSYQIERYLDFVTGLMFWIGVTFETPLIVFFLSRLHIVNYKKLAATRKYAVVGCALVAAVITPTPDPFNMMLVMLPLVLLYEIGIQLSRIGS